jgi:hypothetical protein
LKLDTDGALGVEMPICSQEWKNCLKDKQFHSCYGSEFYAIEHLLKNGQKHDVMFYNIYGYNFQKSSENMKNVSIVFEIKALF